jgi:lipoyl(octanoyl) transferase
VIDVRILELGTRFVPYDDALRLQRELHDDVVSGIRQNTLVLLEHEPVFTAGKRTEADERPTDGTPVIDVDRGGKITWHGPGQLVGYPIIRLPDPIDVVGYVRSLESILLEVLLEFGITAERVEGRSGVWVKRGLTHDKIGAIGIRVAGGVTMHGFALNCSNDLTPYSSIVACGIRDAGVTTMSTQLGRNVEPVDVLPTVISAFSQKFEVVHELT